MVGALSLPAVYPLMTLGSCPLIRLQSDESRGFISGYLFILRDTTCADSSLEFQ